MVELVSRATARNGMRFDNHYCWVVRFDGDTIVEVRAYLDFGARGRAVSPESDLNRLSKYTYRKIRYRISDK